MQQRSVKPSRDHRCGSCQSKLKSSQAALAVHRARDLLMRQRTQLINALRAHLAELGIVAETGREGGAKLVEVVSDARSTGTLPTRDD